jgi:hypothetical protein
MSRINMTFSEKEDIIIDSLKQEYGIQQTTELIRFLLTHVVSEYRASRKSKGEKE